MKLKQLFVILGKRRGGLTEWLRSSPGKRVGCNSLVGSSPMSSAKKCRLAAHRCEFCIARVSPINVEISTFFLSLSNSHRLTQGSFKVKNIEKNAGILGFSMGYLVVNTVLDFNA